MLRQQYAHHRDLLARPTTKESTHIGAAKDQVPHAGPRAGGKVREGPASETLHSSRRQTMSAMTAAFAKSGHGGHIPKIAPPEQRHEHTTTIHSRRPNDPPQHAGQWRAVARCE